MIKDGEEISVYRRGSNQLVDTFTASSDMCIKMWIRYLFFKYNLNLNQVYWRKVK